MKTKLIFFTAIFFSLLSLAFAQEANKPIEFVLDAASSVQNLPGNFFLGVNLNANVAVLEKFEKDIGLRGTYRLKWDFWQIGEEKDKDKQAKLIENYSALIKKISDAKGTVIVSLINTPPGMGRALDKRSAPEDVAKWKDLVKETIKILSCEKKYNVWYEVWDDPTSEEAFLGTEKDYFALYKATARTVAELEKRYNIHIPLGGPAVGMWYDNFGGNSALTPERSLIYDLMRFCSQNNLPLDFISWHAFSTQARAETQVIAYNRNIAQLIRDWMSYFGLKDTALVIDEWNWGLDNTKLLDARSNYAYYTASFVPARLKNVQVAGIDRSVFYSLADSYDEKGNLLENFGLTYGVRHKPKEEVSAKAAYQVFRYLTLLGESWYPGFGSSSAFVDGLATKKGNDLILLFWHYIDPYLVRNWIENAAPTFSEKEQGLLLEIIRTNRVKDILNKNSNLPELSESDKLKQFFGGLTNMYYEAKESGLKDSTISVKIKNIKGRFKYTRYVLDETSVRSQELIPALETRKVVINEFTDKITLKPYSVVAVVLHKLSD
ncbi:MAG: hypothetical protein PHH69_04145 [Candidatus Omnitrophica bacterium]|nr:hypothetical protein [Candidatus Omnitrophota bacterium]MDD5610717.1 hypothetical protein [Candidatus Omnitrophota bacterium]